MMPPPSAGTGPKQAAHDPEKWIPVFGQDHAPEVMRMISTRRTILQLLAGAPFFAAGLRADAREPVMARLIKQARERETVSQRIDFIARSFLGTRYQAHTLIGGPRRKEQFVLRDDAFDCVTYCEAVLAGAIARNFSDYPDILRRIRYEKNEVRWAERNHDFAQWNRNAV